MRSRKKSFKKGRGIVIPKKSDAHYWWMVGLTSGLLVVAGIQAFLFFYQLKDINITAEAAKTSADAAKEQAKIARETFSATNRPWISVGINPVKVKYDKNGMIIELLFNLKNIGTSPAMNVWINPTVTAPILGNADGFNPFLRLKEACESAKISSKSLGGDTIFPNEPYFRPHILHLNNETLQKITEKVDVVSPYIIGCVNYRFSFNKEDRQTGFIVILNKREKANSENFVSFSSSGQDVSASDLRLYYYPTGGSFAN